MPGMSKLSLMLFGSPIADVQTRALRRLTVGAVGAVVSVLLLILVGSFAPVLVGWWWVPGGLVLLFALWCVWQLGVGMHLAAQWLGLIEERPVIFGGVATPEESDGASVPRFGDELALADEEDDAPRQRIKKEGGISQDDAAFDESDRTAPGASRSGTRAPMSDTRAGRSRAGGSSAGGTRGAGSRSGDSKGDPELHRRVPRPKSSGADDDTVDEDA